MKYPIIYDKNTTDFFNLGLGPLTNTIEATVTEERNGAFYFEAEVLINDKYELIKEDSIIKVDASHTLKDQRFRVKRITPTDEGTAKIYAEHISYLAQELSLQPDIHLNGSAQVVLGIWKNSIIDKNPFVVDSDVSTVSSTHFDISEVSNAREALGGVKGSILDRWGGEYRFDNYHISLLKKRGKPANTLLAYGRNITDFEQDRNITNTYTSVYPFAKYTDDNQKEHLVTIPGYLVDSEHVSKYPNRKALPVDFSNEFKDKTIPTADKLKKLAESYIKDNEVGIPKVSIKLSFLDLSKTLDYEELAPLEELSLCDEVRVSYEKLDVNTTAKVIRIVWNVLTESYDEIEIGEKRMTLSSTLNDQSQAIKEIKDQSNYSLTAANGKNTIFYGLYGEDGTGQPIATMIGDMWYKPVGEDTEFYIWDGTTWKFIMSTVDNKIIQETIDSLEAESEQIKQDVDKALSEAEQARDNAFNAKGIADLADEKSNQALADAEAAREEAFDSKAIADEAKLESSKALQKGNHNEVEISKLEGQLKVTNSKVEGNTANLLNLKLESDKLSSSISKTQYELENLTAGGTNLLPKTRELINLSGFYQNSSEKLFDNLNVIEYKKTNINQGYRDLYRMRTTGNLSTSDYTLSFWAKSSEQSLNARCFFYSPNTTTSGTSSTGDKSTSEDGSINVKITNEWKQYWVKWKSGATTQNKEIIIGRVFDSQGDVQLQITGVKLEAGNTVSNWSPAPEDLITKNEFSTFEQTFQGFQSNVEGQFTVAKNDTQKVSNELSNTNNKLDDVDKKANNNANKLDNVDTELVTFKSQQTQMANQINRTVERVENINFGGTNLLLNTKNMNSISPDAVKSPDIFVEGMSVLEYKNNSSNIGYRDLYRARTSNNLVEGEYILSFWAKTSEETDVRCFFYSPGNTKKGLSSTGQTSNSSDGSINVSVTKEWKKYWIIWETDATEFKKEVIIGRLFNSQNGIQLQVTMPKFEKGNKFTDWSPAPEDLANKSEVTQLSDQLTQTITKTNIIEGQISQQQSQVNQLSDKLTVNISDTSANATKISQLELTTSSMSLTLASVERENGRLNTKVVSLEANLNGFQATVSDDLNGVKGQQTLMSTQMNTTISKVETIDGKVSRQQTEITQLSNSISSIVSEFEGETTNVFDDPNFTKRKPLIANDGADGIATYVSGGLNLRWNRDVSYAWFKFPCESDLTLDTEFEITLTANRASTVAFGLRNFNSIKHELSAGQKKTITGKNGYVDGKTFYITVGPHSDVTIHSLKIFSRTGGYLKQSEFHQFSDKFLFQVGTNKLMVTSDTTYIANATIKDGMIDTLTANKITTGTLNGANVNVINLNASNITTGYLNSNRIQARSITANHLAVDAITVGFNNSSTNVKLSGYNIEFLDGGKRSAQITSIGMEFWDGNVFVGSQGRTHKLGNANIRGISNHLEYAGDFITWGYKLTSSERNPTSLLTLDPRGKYYNDGKKGIRVGTDIHFDGLIGCADGTTHMLKFSTVYFNNFNYPALLHKDGKVGVIFGSGELYLMRNNTYVSLGDLMR